MTTRYERVVLDLEDRFAAGMVKDAAAVKLLRRELDSLSGSAVKTARSSSTAEREIANTGKSADASGKQIDKLSGRLALFAQVAAALGPALIPLGAGSIPIIAGMTAELGAAAGAVGVLLAAFHGLGKGLDALNKYQLDPSATNLAALRREFAALGPEGMHFVLFLDDAQQQLSSLQRVARQGLFPGMEDGIDQALTLLPQVRSIVREIAKTLGGLSADAGHTLAGPEFAAFFEYLKHDAAPTLDAFARTLGNFALGFANLIVAFTPVSRQFTMGFLEMSRAFADWSRGLDANQGFQAFLAYVQRTGPQALDLLDALINVFVQIAQAAAPVGDVVLPAMTALLRAFGALADSPVGPMFFTAAAGVAVYSRALALAESVQGRFTTGSLKTVSANAKVGFSLKTLSADLGVVARNYLTAGASSQRMTAGSAASASRLKAQGAAAGKVAGQIGLLAFASSGAADKMHLQNTATLALMGSMAGPWGLAIGAGVGAILDFAGGNDHAASAVDGLTATLNKQTGALTQSSRAWAVHELQSSGALSDAQKLGLDLGTVTSAVLGEKDALAQVNAELDAHIVKLGQSTSGNSDLTGAQIEASHTASALKSIIGDTAGQVQATTSAWHLEKSAMDSATSSEMTFTKFQKEQTQAIRDSVDAMREKRKATLAAFDAETQWRQALKDATAQGKKNDAGIQGSSKAALDNRNALSQLAGAWNNQSEKVKTNVDRFREARKAFIETATAMGVPEAAAKRLADSMLEIPKQRVVEFIVRDRATGVIDVIKSQLASIDRNVDIYFRAHTTRLPSVSGMGPQLADGGTIPGPRYPYRDKVLLLGAPGEEVITNRNGQADAFRRDRAAGLIPAYGNGGQVQRWDHQRAQSAYMAQRSHRAGSGAGTVVRLTFDDVDIRGTLKSAHGPVDVAGTARVVARQEIADHARREEEQAGR